MWCIVFHFRIIVKICLIQAFSGISLVIFVEIFGGHHQNDDNYEREENHEEDFDVGAAGFGVFLSFAGRLESRCRWNDFGAIDTVRNVF